MKQLIIMIAMIGLGMVIAGLVIGFSTEAKGLAQSADTAISYTDIATPK